MDVDRLEAARLAGAALDWGMRRLDLVPAELSTRLDGRVVLVALGERLTGLWGEGCPDHGACMAVVEFMDGRLVQLGTVTDADDLAAAITGHPGLDAEEAGRLLADLEDARVAL